MKKGITIAMQLTFSRRECVAMHAGLQEAAQTSPHAYFQHVTGHSRDQAERILGGPLRAMLPRSLTAAEVEQGVVDDRVLSPRVLTREQVELALACMKLTLMFLDGFEFHARTGATPDEFRDFIVSMEVSGRTPPASAAIKHELRMVDATIQRTNGKFRPESVDESRLNRRLETLASIRADLLAELDEVEEPDS